MHISEQYGQVDKGVLDTTLPGLTSPCDSWTEGARQKELNERGAYIHRFQDQNSLTSVIAAVRKISEDNICTPCTMVGPSLCRTYSHSVWEGCAALLFSPAMHVVLTYKRDLNSDRLGSKNHLSHSNFKSPQRSRSESLELFSDAVRATFNRYDSTPSAFKGRRSKKLNLVVSASHHAAKIQEMEKRANMYFFPVEHFLRESLSLSSKFLLLDFCEHYEDIDLPHKPDLQTKAQVLEFIDTITQLYPITVPLLRAARIKISTFKDDSAVPLYFEKATIPTTKKWRERIYGDFLAWQHLDSQESVLPDNPDKTTTLTPNEVLGMPRPEDLVGLVVDPSTSKSFDHVLSTLEYLKESGASNWVSVAQSVPPFTHLISHLDQGTLVQLGWSKMIIPYSTEGLKEFCETEKITAIDGCRFTPDYFLLLHRIASNSVLVFSKEPSKVGILFLKPNVINNFSSILADSGKNLLFDAIERGKIDTETLRLFCHLDRLGAGNFSNVREAYFQTRYDPKYRSTLSSLMFLDDQGAEEDLKNLLTTHINRIENSTFRNSGGYRSIKYRAGFEDHGIFEFNPSLGSLSLTEGARKNEKNTRWIGIFTHNRDMHYGGASLTFGMMLSVNECKFGHFEYSPPPFSISRMPISDGPRHFRLLLGRQEPPCMVDFAVGAHAFANFYLYTKVVSETFKIKLLNPDWTGGLNQIIREPIKALRFIIDAVKAAENIREDMLGSTIVCLSAVRHAVSLQLIAAANLDQTISTYKPMHSESTRELKKEFQKVIHEINSKISTLAPLYRNIDPNCDELDSKLYRLIDTAALPIRTYLSSKHQLNVKRPKATPVGSPALTFISTRSSPNSLSEFQLGGPTAATPARQKKNLARKLISGVKRTLKIKA